jgi:hypothetical protein
MADNNYFSHTSQDGRSPFDRARAQNVRASGENIAAGTSSAQGVLEQWKKSNGHCKNMMSKGAKMFAVAYGYNRASKYQGHYWTQMFGSSIAGLDTACYPEGSGSGLLLASTGAENETISPAFLAPAPSVAVAEPWSHETANESGIELADESLVIIESVNESSAEA